MQQWGGFEVKKVDIHWLRIFQYLEEYQENVENKMIEKKDYIIYGIFNSSHMLKIYLDSLKITTCGFPL